MKPEQILERILDVYQESVKVYNHQHHQHMESSSIENQPQYNSSNPEIDGNYFLFFNEIYTTPLRKFLKNVLKKLAWPVLKRQVFFNTEVRKTLYGLIQVNNEHATRISGLNSNIETLLQLKNEQDSKTSDIEQKIEALSQLNSSLAQIIRECDARISHVEQKIEALSQLKNNLAQISQECDVRISDLEQKIEVLPQLNNSLVQISKECDVRISDVEQKIDALSQVNNSLSNKVTSVEQAKINSNLWFNDPIIVGYAENGEAYWAGTNERILEKSFVLQSLSRLYDSTDIKVLDVGAGESLLAYELASLNYSVTAIDIRPIALSHPNLNFVKTDICQPVLPEESFDCVVALSTLEHIGLGWYGDRKGDTLDCVAVQQIYSLLKPGGSFILTVPYGEKALTPVHRIYDKELLDKLIQGFDVLKIVYGIRLDDFTFTVTEREEKAAVKRNNPDNYLPGAVAMVICRKAD